MGEDRQQDEPSSSETSDFPSRLGEAREAHAKKHADVPGSTHSLALRVGSDFIAGILVGGLLGWGVDKSFGTSPWGLIIFLALGFVTGTHLAIRSANEINKRAQTGSDN